MNFIKFDEKSQERIGISIDKLEVVNKFIDNYINELDFQVTKKSIEKYNELKKKEEIENFNRWKIEYDKKREKEKFNF